MQILGIGDHISCGSALVREKMVFGVPHESIKLFIITYVNLSSSKNVRLLRGYCKRSLILLVWYIL
jgi:hypothetical protein